MMMFITGALRKWFKAPNVSVTTTDRATETVIVLGAFILVFFLIRTPLFSMGWDGSDANGHDTDIFVHQPAKPNYLLFGRFAGKEQYVEAWGHPGPPYAMFSVLGSIASAFFDYSKLSDGAVIALVKTVASLFQLAIWCPLLVFIAWADRETLARSKRVASYLAVGAFALSPMAIQSSNEFQIDSTFGLLMAGIFGLALVVAERCALRPMFGGTLIVLAAAFVGLGKNEWTLILLLSSAAVLILLLVGSRFGYCGTDCRKQVVFSVSCTLGGLVVGNLTSYLFEPQLYNSGWNLMFRMTGKASVFGQGNLARFKEITFERLPFIQVHLILLAYILWRLYMERKQLTAPIVLASIYGFGLFAAFFLSTWAPYPRYFAPAFGVLCVVGVWLFVNDKSDSRLIINLICVTVYSWITVSGMSFAYGEKLARDSVFGKRDVSALLKPNCAVLIPVEDAYRRKDVDFIHSSWGYEGAVETAKQFGWVVCPPDNVQIVSHN